MHFLRISSLRNNYNHKLWGFSYRILERGWCHVSIAKKEFGFFSQPPIIYRYYILRDCRESPKMSNLPISHLMKSIGYKHQSRKFRVFRQSLRVPQVDLDCRYSKYHNFWNRSDFADMLEIYAIICGSLFIPEWHNFSDLFIALAHIKFLFKSKYKSRDSVWFR